MALKATLLSKCLSFHRCRQLRIVKALSPWGLWVGWQRRKKMCQSSQRLTPLLRQPQVTLRNRSCHPLLLNKSWFGFIFVLWKVPVFGPVHFNLIFFFEEKWGDFPFFLCKLRFKPKTAPDVTVFVMTECSLL